MGQERRGMAAPWWEHHNCPVYGARQLVSAVALKQAVFRACSCSPLGLAQVRPRKRAHGGGSRCSGGAVKSAPG